MNKLKEILTPQGNNEFNESNVNQLITKNILFNLPPGSKEYLHDYEPTVLIKAEPALQQKMVQPNITNVELPVEPNIQTQTQIVEYPIVKTLPSIVTPTKDIIQDLEKQLIAAPLLKKNQIITDFINTNFSLFSETNSFDILNQFDLNGYALNDIDQKRQIQTNELTEITKKLKSNQLGDIHVQIDEYNEMLINFLEDVIPYLERFSTFYKKMLIATDNSNQVLIDSIEANISKFDNLKEDIKKLNENEKMLLLNNYTDTCYNNVHSLTDKVVGLLPLYFRKIQIKKGGKKRQTKKRQIRKVSRKLKRKQRRHCESRRFY